MKFVVARVVVFNQPDGAVKFVVASEVVINKQTVVQRILRLCSGREENAVDDDDKPRAA